MIMWDGDMDGGCKKQDAKPGVSVLRHGGSIDSPYGTRRLKRESSARPCLSPVLEQAPLLLLCALRGPSCSPLLSSVSARQTSSCAMVCPVRARRALQYTRELVPLRSRQLLYREDRQGRHTGMPPLSRPQQVNIHYRPAFNDFDGSIRVCCASTGYTFPSCDTYTIGPNTHHATHTHY